MQAWSELVEKLCGEGLCLQTWARSFEAEVAAEAWACEQAAACKSAVAEAQGWSLKVIEKLRDE